MSISPAKAPSANKNTTERKEGGSTPAEERDRDRTEGGRVRSTDLFLPNNSPHPNPSSPLPPHSTSTLTLTPTPPSLTMANAADPNTRHVAPSDAAPQPDPSDPASKAGKKTAWNRPSNGATELGSVMDAAAWPPLSESARASPKSSSSESLKSLSDGSELVIPNPVPQAKPDPPNPAPLRQKSMKRGGGTANGSIANGGPAPAPGDKAQTGINRPPVVEIPAREGDGRNGVVWDHGGKVGGFSPQGHGRNEHRSGYGGNNRKGGNGGGMHYNGNNGRRDHDRWGHDWAPHPNYGGKHSPMSPHQRPMQRPFFQPPLHGQMPFVGPPSPARPFVASIPFPDVAAPMMYAPGPPLPPDPYRAAVPFAGPPVVFFQLPSPHMPDQDLAKNLIKQIEYYFSNENLCKDVFLRQNMNEEGWVPVTLIADFNKVKQLTNNIQFILETVRASSVVEVQGDKLRRRNEWPSWLIRPHVSPAANNQSSDVPVLDNLAGRMRSMGLGEGTAGHGSTVVAGRPFNG